MLIAGEHCQCIERNTARRLQGRDLGIGLLKQHLRLVDVPLRPTAAFEQPPGEVKRVRLKIGRPAAKAQKTGQQFVDRE